RATTPDWSPDQSKLLFRAYHGLAAVNSDGTGFTYLTAPPTSSFDLSGVWSPDGTKIAFYRLTNMPYPTPPKEGTYVANADGSSPVKIADGASPTWQPVPGPQRSDYKHDAQFCKA